MGAKTISPANRRTAVLPARGAEATAAIESNIGVLPQEKGPNGGRNPRSPLVQGRNHADWNPRSVTRSCSCERAGAISCRCAVRFRTTTVRNINPARHGQLNGGPTGTVGVARGGVGSFPKVVSIAFGRTHLVRQSSATGTPKARRVGAF